jgi:hypothetical protein
MATSFSDWKEAHTAAVHLARQLGREVGVYKTKEYSSTVYQVIHLPKPENRQGFELRCEVVGPGDPL